VTSPVQHIDAVNGTRYIVVRDEDLPVVSKEVKALIEQGRMAQARDRLACKDVHRFTQRLIRQADRPDIMFMMALMYARIRAYAEAEVLYRAILKQERHPVALQELAAICRRFGRYQEALQLSRQALDLDPDHSAYRLSYALDLIRHGQLREGLTRLEELLESDPDNADVHSKLLFHRHYDPHLDRRQLFGAHQQWGIRHAHPSLAQKCHPNDPDPERRLKVGYLSADFYRHSVAYNIEAVLASHEADEIETFGYGNVAEPDDVTERFKRIFHHYRPVYGRDDQELVRLIRQDEIDILVILSGHTEDHRLTACAFKPAPILIDFGSINTTGMEQVDYRVTDERLDPADAQAFYEEKFLYMPQGFVCYRPPEYAPPVASRPLRATGSVTFGSFNNSMKVNPYVVSLWAQVMHANPGSRLILKFAGGGDTCLRHHYEGLFAHHGIDGSRLEMLGWLSPVDHLQCYNRVDVCLDTYPFNGCITTLEGLWMGVPTISLTGPHYISRVGLTILSRLDMACFAAGTPDEFVARASALASRPASLARIRRTLRQRMAASDLCNANKYTRHLEGHYRKVWQHWCRQQHALKARPPICRICAHEELK